MSTEAAEGALDATGLSPVPKQRRKVRKGTRSCWECRNRKIKCVFGSPTDNFCLRCSRRGAKCVGQEHPEVITPSLDRSLQVGDRIVRIETLVDQLLKAAPNNSARTAVSISRKCSDEENNLSSPAQSVRPLHNELRLKSSSNIRSGGFQILDPGLGASLSDATQLSLTDGSIYEGLSKALCQYLPSPEDMEIIVKACGSTSAMFYQMQAIPYCALDETTTVEALFRRPGLDTHPVLIARYILYIATALQHLHPDIHEELRGLSRPPREMMHELVDDAIGMVTLRDDLINSIEGLDCVIIESWYHANNGNLQKALITIRRAITIAQVMGFPQPGKARCTVVILETRAYPELMWFRMLAHERYLCLMLGVPQSTLDRSMASEKILAGETQMGRLDRIHCVVVSQILERNQSDPKADDYALTRELDERLQKASRDMPSGWWLTPNLAAGMHQPATLFWCMRQLFHQLFHHSLLIQLHLPYMLRRSTSGQQYEYSWVTCINSSREILSRLIMFHSFNRISFSCRTIDFFGLMAAIALLIAHVERHQFDTLSADQPWRSPGHINIAAGLLAHQRPCDRALVEQAQRSMSDVGRLNVDDATSMQCSTMLQKMLAIEDEASAGLSSPYSDTTIRLTVPFLGIINITPSGIITQNDPGLQFVIENTHEAHVQATETYETGDACTRLMSHLHNSGTRNLNISTPAGMLLNSQYDLNDEALMQIDETAVCFTSNNASQTLLNVALPFNGEALYTATP
ncbi:hypothetical protein HD806DRAFT_444584 [Xylariaceae sp. AK1471]|nr:hypothetical protein HD806DRAFT_444584 [Xylariaceae sp. AK1471]